jgi:maleate cis-trans isomerase
MYGWRALIGFMLPSSCTVYEPEFQKITAGLDGVIGCPSRLKITQTDAKGLADMNTNIEKAAEELATLKPDLVIYMCTAGSFFKGRAWENEIHEKIKKITLAPVMTTSEAVVESLKALKMSKVAMWTPYDKDVTEREVKFLQENNIQVTDYKYEDIVENLDRGAQHPQRTFYYAKQLDVSQADGIFISCANIRSIEILSLLEQDIKKPVVSSSQATTWLALRKVGITTPINGYGSLLERY